MKETIELRLVNLAQKIADMYADRISQEEYQQLCNAIDMCRKYHIEAQENWGVMYDVVLAEDAIWEYACLNNIEEEISDMWGLVTDILLCNCWLGCVAERDAIGQDMEIQGDNIPEFVDLLENAIEEKIDYERIFDFWGEKMCY